MKRLDQPETLQETLRRIDALSPDEHPRWGSISAPQVVCHLIDGCEIAMGLADSGAFTPSFVSSWIGLWLIIDSPLPWPKGRIKAPAAFHRTVPSQFLADRQRLRDVVIRHSAHPGPWAVSPAFGALSARRWQRLQWRHLDHHLRQFGR